MTVEVGKAFSASVFEVLAADATDVIMMINYLTDKSEKPVPTTPKVQRTKDAFWDF